jgi:hypothetical protein
MVRDDLQMIVDDALQRMSLGVPSGGKAPRLAPTTATGPRNPGTAAPAPLGRRAAGTPVPAVVGRTGSRALLSRRRHSSTLAQANLDDVA